MRKSVFLFAVAVLWGLAAGAENFPVPGPVESRVRFWTRVYTEIGTDGGFVHDSRNLDLVYGTLRFPERASWRSQKRAIRAAKNRYRNILEKLARGRRTGLSSEEQRVLALFPEGVKNSTLSRAARSVRFQLGQADKFRAGLERASLWEAHIREVIAEHRVPAELSALPHVESSYDPGAVSKAGAAGLWQFTRSTGRLFMRVDHVVDERFDPYRASEAAARLLRQNYEKTGSWPLAITAYNHGVNGVRRAVRTVGTKDIGVITERYRSRRFGFASRNFYSEFLAALHVEINAERYFGTIEPRIAEEPETVRLDHYYPATAVAQAFSVPVRELRRLNPALRGPVWNGQKHIPKGFELRLPAAAERPAATTLLASIPAGVRFVRQRPDMYYRVQRGDTLSTIARRYGVRQSDIVALNGIRNKHRIRAGQRIRIPESHQTRVAARSAAARKPRVVRSLSEDGSYTVQRGDNLTEIARDLGVTTDDLVMANGLLRPNHLEVGQVLRVAVVRADQTDSEVADVEDGESPESEGKQLASSGTVTPEDAFVDSSSGEGDAPAEAPEVELEPSAASAQTASSAPDTAAPTADAANLPIELDVRRYAVDGKKLRVQPEETLGHYAHWLDLPTSRLRRLNGLRYGTPVVIGQRLRLDFSRVSVEEFEKRRLAHHRQLRERFFERNRIAGTEEHVLRRGETLWELSQRRYRVPVWLLSDYNRDIDFASLRVGVRLTIPRVESV